MNVSIKPYFVQFLLFMAFCSESLAQVRQGIQFINGDFEKIVTFAKVQNKPIFIEIYLKGCPHCEALEPILAEQEVGNFYNQNFICWRVEANSKESQTLQKEKGITYPEFPFFFFFDKTGSLVHLASPAERPTKVEFMSEVILHGKTAINPQLRASNYAHRFQTGERDVMFLVNYGKYCKTMKDTMNLHKINTVFGKLLILPNDIVSPIGFYVIRRLIDDFDNPLAQYFFIHLSQFNGTFEPKEVIEAGETIIFNSLYGTKPNTIQKIIQMREYMKLMGVPAVDADARTLLKELEAYFWAKNTKGAVQRFDSYRLTNTKIGIEDYAYLMRYFNEKATDNSYLSFMAHWADSGLKTITKEQKNSKTEADIYFELAKAYQKMGKQTEAIANAHTAFEIAKAAKIELKPYETLKATLK